MNFLIAQRPLRVLRLNERKNLLLDAVRGARPVPGAWTGKQLAHANAAAIDRNVLSLDGPADRRHIDAEQCGNVLLPQRLFLAADKIRGLLLRSNQQNLLQQGVPIKQPALQSACLIGALAQELANLRVIGIGKETGIRLVDRQRTAVDKLHVKTVFAVYEIGIRDDILWIVVGKAVGRSRIEISNQSKCLFGLFLRHVKETCQHTGARPAQKQLPVHTDNSFGQRIALGKTPELQQEAFLQAASADSGRLQRLNRLQRIFYRRLAHAKFTRC